MKAVVVAVVVLLACKSKPDPAPADPPKTALPPGAPDDRGGWAVGTTTSDDGRQLIVNYRASVPDGITPSAFPTRVTVECPYPDRGDGTGMPTKEQLDARQDFEEHLESPSAILMLSSTGEGRRDMIFQVVQATMFSAGVSGAAKKAGLDCSVVEVVPDSEWSLWRSAATHSGSK